MIEVRHTKLHAFRAMYHWWRTKSASEKPGSRVCRPVLPRILYFPPIQVIRREVVEVYRGVNIDVGRPLDGYLYLPRDRSTLTFVPRKCSSEISVYLSEIDRVDLQQQMNSGQDEHKCFVKVRAIGYSLPVSETTPLCFPSWSYTTPLSRR